MRAAPGTITHVRQSTWSFTLSTDSGEGFPLSTTHRALQFNHRAAVAYFYACHTAFQAIRKGCDTWHTFHSPASSSLFSLPVIRACFSFMDSSLWLVSGLTISPVSVSTVWPSTSIYSKVGLPSTSELTTD